MSQADTVAQIKTNQGLAEPPMFKVIYLNDSATPMDFVIETLVGSFDYTQLKLQRFN